MPYRLNLWLSSSMSLRLDSRIFSRAHTAPSTAEPKAVIRPMNMKGLDMPPAKIISRTPSIMGIAMVKDGPTVIRVDLFLVT